MKPFIVMLCVLLSCATVSAGAPPDDVTPSGDSLGKDRLGIAITPAHFPRHTTDAMQAAFTEAARLGRYAVLISQWSALDTGAVKNFMMASRRHGLVPIIGMSPTLLTGGRKELDLPQSVRQAAGRQLSYANPVVRAAFVDAAVGLAGLKPPYLCLATEINFLAIGNLREYLLFSETYRQAYQAVKKVSPTTQVFVSFQWDLMRLIDDKEPDRLNEHGKVIDLFRPALDRLVITTYPAPHFASPRQVPADYFRSLDRHADRSEPILIMEIGWPTSGSGSEGEQAEFIARLPELTRGLRIEALAWALLHDVRLAEFDANLNSVGLRAHDGRAKPGLEAFRRLQ